MKTKQQERDALETIRHGKEYKLPTLNTHYQELLEILIWENGNTERFGTSQIKRIRPIYNRLRKSPVWQKIAERGNQWELIDFAKHITNGEILANQETFLWYLIDRYEDHGSRFQITIYQAADDKDCVRWHIHELCNWLRGLSIRYPDLIHFAGTHGLGAITFKRAYNNQ